MSREGYQLTEAAAAEREDFRDRYGSEQNCSCFISPPCSCCAHPGNPRNQKEDDEWWEIEYYPDRSSVTVVIQDGVRALYRLVLGPGGWSVVHRKRNISRKRKNQILSMIAKEAGQRISKVRREFTFISLKD